MIATGAATAPRLVQSREPAATTRRRRLKQVARQAQRCLAEAAVLAHLDPHAASDVHGLVALWMEDGWEQTVEKARAKHSFVLQRR